MTHNIEVDGGKTVKLPTAGKYCDRDIIVSGKGHTEADMEAKYTDGWNEGHCQGYTDGQFDANQQCEAEYFKTSLFGSGTGALNIPMPWGPDVFAVSTASPLPRAYGGGFYRMAFDLRSAGYHAGVASYFKENKTASTWFRADSLSYFTFEDGMFEIKSTIADVVWREDTRYDVVAVRFPDWDMRALVEEQVSLLPDGEGGTVEYNQAQIGTVFTADEWAALIATKPNWTFAMV